MASNKRRCGPRSPSCSASSMITAVRGSVLLWTGWPSPGTKRPAARCSATARRASASHCSSVEGSASETLASTPARKRAVSSVTPRKRDPPPSRPAAIAPWKASGALYRVRRAAIAVGVKPWSASETSTASNMRTCCGVGRRCVASQSASSPKPTLPISSPARSWPSRRILVASEVPIPVGYSIACPFFILITPGALDAGPVSSLILQECSGYLAFMGLGARRLTKPGANLLAILAQSRGRQRVARRRSRERDRVADHRHGLVPAADLDDGIEANLAGKGYPRGDGVDWAAGNAGGAQAAEPLVGCPCAQPFNQERAQG